MSDAPSLEIYPRYCFHLAPTFNEWCFLRAADIQCLKQPEGFQGQDFYFYRNLPMKWARIVGIVVAIDEFASKRIYTIDDSSGVCIEALTTGTYIRETQQDAEETTASQHWWTELAKPNTAPRLEFPFDDIDIGAVVDIKGGLSIFRDEMQIKVKKMTPLRGTMQEVILWKKRTEFRRRVLDKPWILSRIRVKNCQKEAERSEVETEKRKAKTEAEAREKKKRLLAFTRKMPQRSEAKTERSKPAAETEMSKKSKLDFEAQATSKKKNDADAEVRRKRKAVRAFKEAKDRSEAAVKAETEHLNAEAEAKSIGEENRTQAPAQARAEAEAKFEIEHSKARAKAAAEAEERRKIRRLQTYKEAKEKAELEAREEAERSRAQARTEAEAESRRRKKALLAYKQLVSSRQSKKPDKSSNFEGKKRMNPSTGFEEDAKVETEADAKSKANAEAVAEARRKKKRLLAYKQGMNSRYQDMSDSLDDTRCSSLFRDGAEAEAEAEAKRKKRALHLYKKNASARFAETLDTPTNIERPSTVGRNGNIENGIQGGGATGRYSALGL